MTTWDAVWLNDEVDLLRWRFTLLRDVVDRFVVVEGDRTFTGKPKESAYAAHQKELEALGVQVHHVVVPLDAEVASPWDRENQQRRGLARALEDLASPGDLLVVGDVDEVPDPNVIARLERTLDRPVRLHMRHLNYFANWAQPSPWDNSAWAYRHGQAVHHRMLWVHLGDTHSNFDGYVEEYLPDAGWHVSFLGGEQAVRAKWASYSHQEYNTEVDRAPGHLERCFRYGVHFQGRVLLEKLRHDEVDPGLLSLKEIRPDFFRFEKPAHPAARRSYRAWTWLRRTYRVPAPLRVAVDRHGVLYLLCSPFLLVLDAALETARRIRRRRSQFASVPWEALSEASAGRITMDPPIT
jgi:hypothetical protein